MIPMCAHQIPLYIVELDSFCTVFDNKAAGQDYYTESHSPSLVLLVYLVWVVLSSVLLLNLLIAMMGKTFQRDDEDTDRIWTFPFAALVLKYEKLLTNDQVNDLFHSS
jgi:hypothetical protein